MWLDKWERNRGIYLGARAGRFATTAEAKPEPINLLDGSWASAHANNEYVGDRHILMFGPNGSGKSWRVLLPNLCSLTDWSIVVVDPKGALAAHTAIHRAKLNEHGEPTRKVIVIDPFQVIEETYPHLTEKFPFFKSHGLNPVAALDPDAPDGESYDDARTMAEALIKIDPKGEAHWAQSAQGIVKGLLLALEARARRKGEHASLADVRKMIAAPPELLAGSILKMCGEISDYPIVVESLNRFTKFSPESRELFGILSTAITQTEWLGSPRIRRDLSSGAFDFGLLKQEPITVYLVLPPRYLATHATWLRLMITSILLPLLRSVEDAPVPVLFALDEYAALGHMEVIENNMALMREYGVKLFPVLQDLTQLKDVHPDRWESFIGNAGIRLLFAPQDYTTQEYFSDISGRGVWTYEAPSQQFGGGLGGPRPSFNYSSTSGQHKTLVPRFAPSHLGSMRKGQALLFVAETRTGVANIARRSVLPDPRSVTYDASKALGDNVLNDTARVIAEARHWMHPPGQLAGSTL